MYYTKKTHIIVGVNFSRVLESYFLFNVEVSRQENKVIEHWNFLFRDLAQCPKNTLNISKQPFQMEFIVLS